MALKLEQKKVIVAEVAEQAKRSISAVVSDYGRISANEMVALRSDARKQAVYLRVIRNTLAIRAFEGTPFECIRKDLTGTLIFAFSETDPGAPARLVREFNKKHDKLNAKVLSINGQRLSRESLDILAALPTREEALSKLMSAMQAPIVKLVRVLCAPQAKLVRTFAAVRDKRQAAE